MGDQRLCTLANRTIYVYGAFPSCKQKCIIRCNGWMLESNKFILGARYHLIATEGMSVCLFQGWRGFPVLGGSKLGQFSERHALTQLLGKTYCLCNTGSKQDDRRSPLWSGSLGIKEWRRFAFAVACGDTKAPWSFKHFGVFIL